MKLVAPQSHYEYNPLAVCPVFKVWHQICFVLISTCCELWVVCSLKQVVMFFLLWLFIIIINFLQFY